MAHKSIAGEIEGDFSKVPVQVTAGEGEQPARPTKGSELVWGGNKPGSPWAHLVSLIDKAGGSVSYTLLHAADLEQESPKVELKNDDPAPFEDHPHLPPDAKPDEKPPKEEDPKP